MPTNTARSPASPQPAIAPFSAEQARQYQETWADRLRVEVEVTNSIGMKLALIPPGHFIMGSSEEEIDRFIAALATVRGTFQR